MDSNEIIAMFDEYTLPLSKAKALLSVLAIALQDKDKLWNDDVISSVEVIRDLVDEGLKGFDGGFHQWGDASAAATAKASKTNSQTKEIDHV